MPFINEINFNNISTINGVAIDASGGDITSLTDWNTRLSGTYSEGDYAVWSATGAVYRWAAGLRDGGGDWVRQEAYSSSYAHEVYLDGSEANDAAVLANGWTTISTSGNGNIDYDGTHVVLSGTSASSAFDQALINNAASGSLATSSYAWVCGQFKMPYFNSSWEARLFSMRDGSFRITFRHTNTNTRIARTNTSNVVQDTQYLPNSEGEFSSSTVEKHVAVYLTPYISSDEPGMVALWIDHSLVPYHVGRRNLVSNSGSKFFMFLAQDTTGTNRGCVLAIRNYTAGII